MDGSSFGSKQKLINQKNQILLVSGAKVSENDRQSNGIPSENSACKTGKKERVNEAPIKDLLRTYEDRAKRIGKVGLQLREDVFF